MRRILLCGLSLLAAGALSCSAATVGSVTPLKPAGKLAQLTQKNKSLKALTSFWNRSVNGVKHAAEAVDDAPVATMTSNGGWGQLEGEDGSTWYYTTEYTVDGYYYSGATVTVYDNNHEQVASIPVQLPEGRSFNSIQPYGTITSKFFDLSASTKELLIGLHAVGDASNNYQGAYYTQVYELGDGSLAHTFMGNGVQVNIEQNSWTKYQRLILVNDSSVATGEIDEFGLAVTTDYEIYDIYKPASWGSSEPSLEHRFMVDLDLTYYSNGQPFNIYTIDKTPYYAVAKYEKPYVSGYDSSTWDPILTEDNSYNVVVYDKNYAQVDSISLTFDAPDGVLYRMPGFGELSTRDLSKNFFSADGQFDYIITFDDYMTASDDYCYTFSVYNSTDGKTKTICDNVYNTWGQLKDIEGEEEQWYFMRQVGSDQSVQTVNLPSCEAVTTFPSTIEGELISTSLNRYPTKDGYKYVMKMGQAASDDSGNVIARLAWYNAEAEATLDHYVSFNLGPDAENFSANLQSDVLNPYLFNTDDKLEYFYIAKVKDTESGRIDDYLFVANEDGEVLKQFNYEESKGDLYTAYVNTSDAQHPELEVVYCDDNSKYTFDFFALPFTKFAAGGDGTAANPYLISSMGDLAQVANEPAASYRFACDIDASTYPVAWTPIDNFSGTLNGAGHFLSNLTVKSDESTVGLFGTMGNGAKVSDLTLLSPSLVLQTNNQYAGILAGSAIGDSIQNVHVYDAKVSGDAGATLGGLVGEAALYSYVGSSSFNGVINAPSASPVGGIIGDARTSSCVEAVAASGDFTAASTLGGIIGTTGSASSVANAHSSANLTAGNNVGGIVAENGSRGTVTNCLAEGTLTANKLTYPSWQKYSLGGIVGTLASNWGTKDTVNIVRGCVSNANLVAGEIDGTVHRIVGYTIANEEGSKTTEASLDSNYVAAAVTINGQTVSSDDATSVEGADAVLNNELFATTLAYAFGATAAEPWKQTESLPVLYFENATVAVTVDKDVLNLAVNEEGEVVVTVYGGSAENVEATSSDDAVASVGFGESTDNTQTLVIKGEGDGTATITVSVDGFEATVTVYVGTAAGIGAVQNTSGRLAIVPVQGSIKAEGATSMTLFSTNGAAVTRTAGQTIATEGLAKGIYVVIATDAKGQKTAAKVVIK